MTSSDNESGKENLRKKKEFLKASLEFPSVNSIRMKQTNQICNSNMDKRSQTHWMIQRDTEQLESQLSQG